MTPTTMTTEAAREALATIDNDVLPTPAITISWHPDTREEALSILAAFPDADWKPKSYSGSEWLNAKSAKLELTLFVPATAVEAEAPLAKALLAEVRGA